MKNPLKKYLLKQKVTTPDLQRNKKIEKGVKDFAVRFEDVMRELSNG